MIPVSLLYKLVKKDPAGKLPGLIVAEGSKKLMARALRLRGGDQAGYFVAMGSMSPQVGQFWGGF